mgnify:FL=1
MELKYGFIIVKQVVENGLNEMDYKTFKLYLECCGYTTWNKDWKVRESYTKYKQTGEIIYNDNRRKTRKGISVSVQD